jgi:uncharacterized protein (UPF0305 family)
MMIRIEKWRYIRYLNFREKNESDFVKQYNFVLIGFKNNFLRKWKKFDNQRKMRGEKEKIKFIKKR